MVGLRPVFFVPGTPHGKPGQVVRTWSTRPVRWFTEALVVDLRMNVEVRGIPPSVPFEGKIRNEQPSEVFISVGFCKVR